MGGGAYGAVGEVSDVAERLCFSALGPPQVALLLRHEIVRHPLSPHTHTHTHNLQPHEMPSDGGEGQGAGEALMGAAEEGGGRIIPSVMERVVSLASGSSLQHSVCAVAGCSE